LAALAKLLVKMLGSAAKAAKVVLRCMEKNRESVAMTDCWAAKKFPMLADTKAPKVLNGSNLAVERVPIKTPAAHARISGYIDLGMAEGAQLLADGPAWFGWLEEESV
jgi:hypothetical protein